MRDVICQKICSYYQPHKDEAEKCLAFELLTAWNNWEPKLRSALTDNFWCTPHPDPLPSRGEGRTETTGAVSRQGSVPPPLGVEELRETICSQCAFQSHGCDFVAQVWGASPCGGLLALDRLLKEGVITGNELAGVWERFLMTGYLRLAEHVSLRYLETPHLYDRRADELYEVNETGFEWLAHCDGTTSGLAAAADREFLDFLLTESLLACAAAPTLRLLIWRRSPIPSLRYLELMLTERCNLRCRHCYLGEVGNQELPLAAVLRTLEEFQEMQGLRVLLSGGEPLLYSRWQELNERLPEFELRLVLLSNGLLLTDKVIKELNVQEVQLSLDGLETGHEMIRGKGTWAKTVGRLEALQDEGLEISVATMIHRGNLAELAKMSNWLQELGIREWNLDIPCIGGRLAQNQDLCLDPEEGAKYLELGFGGSDHGATGDFACGRHLAAVLPNGNVAKCGLYGDMPLGSLEEGLENCWLRLPHLQLRELDCAPCAHVSDCRGGCRFRAGSGLGPDPVMCARYGVDLKTFRR
jgi:radical SAM protein with 4Fe4S-binding SPASM domain